VNSGFGILNISSLHFRHPTCSPGRRNFGGSSALKSANTRLTTSNTELEGENAKLIKSRDNYKAKHDSIKSERDDSLDKNQQLQNEFRSIKRQLTKAIRELDHARSELELTANSELVIRSFETVTWFVESGIENHGIVFAQNICLEGDGPWDETDLKRLLKSAGFNPINCRSRGARKNEIIVVGREADVDLIEEHINSREDEPVKMFPQELFIAALACGSDPFNLIEDLDDEDPQVPEFLEAFGRGHPVIEYLKGLQFPWPEIGYQGGDPVESKEPPVPESPLAMLGYHVGIVADIPEATRQDILMEAYQAEELPRVDLRPQSQCNEYMKKWGQASTRARLRRMAWHIAWLIRKNHNKPTWKQAIREWRADLDWMEENIYKRVMRFDWPVIR
jgi:hypothetical protein